MKKLLAHSPWLLLVVVAVSQLFAARVFGLLNPAKGGGFGLFSTVDKLENRLLRARLLGLGTETAVGAESASDEAAMRRTLAAPTDANLHGVAALLLARDYPAAVEGVRVEVWKQTFSAATHEVRRVKVHELTVRRDER